MNQDYKVRRTTSKIQCDYRGFKLIRDDQGWRARLVGFPPMTSPSVSGIVLQIDTVLSKGFEWENV